MTKILLIVFGIAIAGLAVAFAIVIASVVSLSLFELRSPQLPLFIWLAMTFLSGLVLGLLVAIGVFFRAKSRERKFRKARAADRKESSNLQKDSVLT